ncbi:MAG TPA: 3D domain-containing protein [Vicinamibacterales bacterium]|nr:3D domain-containing protein [Vicinamibacterales bacterium]
MSRSFRRKLLATALTAIVFTLLYQATVIDSRAVGEVGLSAVGPPSKGSRGAFEATAYCRGTVTASGVNVRAGIAAADPKILPIGSVIQVDGVAAPYHGIYTVLDTGPEIQGREIDIYMWNCDEAVQFGRKQVKLTVLRSGWATVARR